MNEVGNEVYGFAFLPVNNVAVDLGGGNTVVPEQLGDGVKIRTEREHHRGVGVAGRMESDVLADAGHPGNRANPVYDILLGNQMKDLVGRPGSLRLCRQPVIGFVREGDLQTAACLDHLDGDAVALLSLFYIAPGQGTNIADTQTAQAAEHESLLLGFKARLYLGKGLEFVNLQIDTRGKLLLDLGTDAVLGGRVALDYTVTIGFA